MELWKPIKNYENYKINRNGVVVNSNFKIIKPEISNNGYLRVSLCKKQIHKKLSIHRLVAQAFIPNPNNLTQVNHKDENKKNNNVENLEWCTPLYNLSYSNIIKKGNKAHNKKIRCITTNEIFDSIKKAEVKYKLHHSNIVACCNGRRKKCGNMEWEYVL